MGRRCMAGVFVALGVSWACLANAQETADGASVRQAVEAKRFAEAYAAGKAAPQAQGAADFDFFWGYAAIEADHPADGVLALQRYLLRQPGDAVAQFLLARGYFALGEDEAAKPEFEALAASPQAEIAAGARQYLAAIEARDARKRPNLSAYVGVGLGYDDNITTGIARGTSPSIPGFGSLPTQPNASTGVAAADAYVALNGGLTYAYPLTPERRLLFSLSADDRRMAASDNRMFDQQALRGDAAYLAEVGANQYRVGLGLNQSWVDQQRYLQSSVLGGEWVRALGDQDRIALNLQFGLQRFAPGCSYFLRDRGSPCVASDNTQRDSRIASIGVGWAHQATGRWTPLYQLGFTWGKEDNQADQPSLSRDLGGVRAGVRLIVAAQQQLALGLGWQASRYDANYPVASVPRRDDLVSLDAQWQWQMEPRWQLIADAYVARQGSNIGLYDYDRATLSLSVRRLFD